jgi:hypothetical protein
VKPAKRPAERVAPVAVKYLPAAQLLHSTLAV